MARCVLRRLRDETERLPHLVGVHPTGGRKRNAFALAFKQRRADQCLQLLDLVTDGAVRQVQFLGGAGHAAQPSGGFKGA